MIDSNTAAQHYRDSIAERTATESSVMTIVVMLPAISFIIIACRSRYLRSAEQLSQCLTASNWQPSRIISWPLLRGKCQEDSFVVTIIAAKDQCTTLICCIVVTWLTALVWVSFCQCDLRLDT